MGKAKQLDESTRRCVIELFEVGVRAKDIAIRLRISKSSVSRLINSHLKTGSTKVKPRSGRPPKITTHTKRRLRRRLSANPFSTPGELQSEISPLRLVSQRAIRRYCAQLGFPSKIARQKPLTSGVHRRKRIEFCKKTLNWSLEQWENVMWSDESNFYLFHNTHRYVRRPKKSDPCNFRYTRKNVKHPPYLMIWGCMSSTGRGGLYFLPKSTKMNAARYKSILEEHLLPFMAIRNTRTFMQDGAPCHTAKMVTRWLADKNIEVMKWPPNSPDLNPIENLWSIMKQKVSSERFTSLEEMKKRIQNIWIHEISTELCTKLAHSMPRRVAAVLRNKGYPCKY